jgi:hypothetical protein
MRRNERRKGKYRLKGDGNKECERGMVEDEWERKIECNCFGKI